jgi:FkbM family methyltransferase
MKHESAVREDFIRLCTPLNIKVIYECGSRDAMDGCELASRLAASELHVFECNPPAVALCDATLSSKAWPFATTLNALAVSDVCGVIDFFPVDPTCSVTQHSDGNIGASSIFEISENYPHEKLTQSRITVSTVRLDDYAKDHTPPDLLWLDVQGAEVLVLKGASEVLRHVQVIHVEVAFRPVFSKQPLFTAVDALLRRDFRLVRLYGSRALWKTALLRLNRWIAWSNFLGVGPWFTDAVYVRRECRHALSGQQ